MGTRRHTRSFWEALLAEVDRGDSVEAVAGRHRVRPRTLTWWRWHLGREASRLRPNGPRLLPVVVRDAPPVVERATSEITLVVADVRLQFDVGVDTSYVAALVGSLRRAC